MPRPHERLRVFCSHLKPRQCPAGAVSTLRQALSADEEAEALGLLCTPLSPVFGVRVHGRLEKVSHDMTMMNETIE